tara:strand:+ start:268 stop:723 length:456 start_codon:yes stop_codon:yes gene_type:complete
MKISEIIPLKNIFLDINAASKKALFKLISKKISIRFKIDQNEILDNLNQREKLGSTGIGNGIAIPHSKIKGIKKIFSLFLRSKSLIDFSSNDTKGVNIIFVIIAPENSTTEHLLALSEISKFLKTEGIIEKLRKLETNKEIHQLLLQANED